MFSALDWIYGKDGGHFEGTVHSNFERNQTGTKSLQIFVHGFAWKSELRTPAPNILEFSRLNELRSVFFLWWQEKISREGLLISSSLTNCKQNWTWPNFHKWIEIFLILFAHFLKINANLVNRRYFIIPVVRNMKYIFKIRNICNLLY